LFHNSNVFGSCIIHILYTGCAKIKKNSGAERLMGCIQSSSFEDYDGIHIMGRHHQLGGTVTENQDQVKGIAVH
jgi:hypothetical protein